MKRILFLLVAWMAAWSVQAQTTQPDANGYLVKVGDQAPDFTVTLTDGSMTRFIMSLEEAVDLVLFAFEHGENGDLLIQKAPACTIRTQAEAVCELFGGKKEDIKIIGIRHGEKMYETLLTNEECAKAVDMGDFYRVPADNRGLNYDKYFKDGDETRNTLTEFNSNNTKRLTLEETKEKIASLAYIQAELAKMKQ